MDLACNTLYTDNEENVTICLKLAVELHKTYRGGMEAKAPLLFEWAKTVSFFHCLLALQEDDSQQLY